MIPEVSASPTTLGSLCPGGRLSPVLWVTSGVGGSPALTHHGCVSLKPGDKTANGSCIWVRGSQEVRGVAEAPSKCQHPGKGVPVLTYGVLGTPVSGDGMSTTYLHVNLLIKLILISCCS